MGFKGALIWNFISQLGQNGVNFLSIIILARILTPADFGIIGMVSIFIAFSQMLVDSEFGGALLRKPDISRLDYSTLFVYNIIVSIILYAILFSIAPLVAGFYDKPQLVEIIRVLSVTVVLHSFRVVQRVIVFRNMQFKQVAVVSIISGLISLGTAIWMALQGFGYWSLIWQQIVGITLSVVLLGIVNRYIPAIRFSYESFKYQFSFGIGLLGADTLRTIANNINTNVIAKIMPIADVGYFVQSNRISNFAVSFVGSITDQTVFPVLARLQNKDEVQAKYMLFYQLSVALLSVMTVWIILLSRPIVLLLLGEQWIGACWMIAALSMSVLPNMIQMLCRNLLKIVAKTKKMFFLEIVKSVAVIAALVLSAYWGIYVIVWGFVIAQWIVAIYYVYATKGYLKIKFSTQMLVVAKNVLRCILIGVVDKGILFLFPQMNILVEILLVTVVTTVLFAITMYMFREKEMIALAKNVIRFKHG